MPHVDLTVIRRMVDEALAEDVGPGDITADLLPLKQCAEARLITREEGVLCGQAWFEETVRTLDADAEIDWLYPEASPIAAKATLCEVRAHTRALLTAERVALNFLQTLSGTASRTAQYVAAVAGTGAIILDTRKTLPGWRRAQKYAVEAGGGQNHRLGLYDAMLIKENHIATAGSIRAVMRHARAVHPGVMLEIEVETLEQLREAVEEQPDRILLDNFSLPDIQRAVAETRGAPPLEVSGGVSLENVRILAETGIAYISVGDLTKNIRALDLSLRVASAARPPRS
ncbi:MAG TPA: carboxylating nicotinate-nucleotide diphosphorylase [Acidiferrobacteraceae bacterium]|nr:carboxylating nicotinate-nucleotide diphosphorylase [Acidiferrobacteraceae bacterium]